MISIALILAMLLFGILGTSTVHLTANMLASANEDLQSSQAFYVAEGGLQYVHMSQLNGDSDFSDNVPPTDPPFGNNAIALSPGEFWVEYLNQATDSVTVKITSRVGSAVRVIEQSAGQSGTGQQYVTMAGGNINANGSSGNIYGDVGLRGNINVDEDVVVNGNIYEDPNLVLPTLDFNTYEAMCDSTHSGNLTISSNYTGDLCVTGNVKINAGVTYTGLLYADGNIDIQGDNVVVNGSLLSEGNVVADHRDGLQFNAQEIAPGQHMPAIANMGNLSIKDSDGMVVNGVIWNDGNLDLTNSDDLQYRGSFMIGGNVILNSTSNISVTFDADLLAGIPGLSGGGGTQTGSLSLSAWKTYGPWW
jgi:hypothetical protein